VLLLQAQQAFGNQGAQPDPRPQAPAPGGKRGERQPGRRPQRQRVALRRVDQQHRQGEQKIGERQTSQPRRQRSGRYRRISGGGASLADGHLREAC
jgi:hypothetical protein